MIKATEMPIFDRIFAKRGGVSGVSGTPLLPKGNKMYHWQFSHILTKGAFPKFKLNEDNIVLMTPDEHILWENFKWKIRDKPEWKPIFDLEERLKQEYYAN